jgi:glycosyltransferase involved in cell wall biosynthesis
MIIGIVTTYSQKHPAGLERFILEFLKALSKVDNFNEYIIYTKKGSGLNKKLIEEGVNNFLVVEMRGGMLWKDLGLFFAPKADIYLFNGLRIPLFFVPKNYLVLVYDFAYKYKNLTNKKEKIKRYVYDFLAKLAFKRAKHIISISQSTKHEIVKFFNINKEKIKVIYCGFNKISNLSAEKVNLEFNKYFLFIGTIKERKNILGLVKAFIILNKLKPKYYSLVIAGKHDKNSEYFKNILKLIKYNKLENQILFTGHINDEQLKYLYQNSIALVFPSLLEGFGLPILEAMDCGVPVITSNFSSLAEVADKAAILVDPYDNQDICDNMLKVDENQELRSRLIDAGYSRVNIFSWDKMAKEFIDLFYTIK